MTDRKQALTDLLEKVKAGDLPEAVFHGSAGTQGHWAYATGLNRKQRRNVFLAYRDSLDAGLKLMEAVLPGWKWSLEPVREGGQVFVCVFPHQDHILSNIGAISHSPARALLIAILEALIAEEGE